MSAIPTDSRTYARQVREQEEKLSSLPSPVRQRKPLATTAPPLLKEKNSPPATVPARPTQEVAPVYQPPASAFPNPLPTVPVQLPGDGSPDALREYFSRTYGVRAANSTADRARKLCAKIAAAPPAPPAGYDDPGAWWERWTEIRQGEEDGE